jgi:hypothetical protein
MARKISVQLVGDTRALTHALDGASRHVGKFERHQSVAGTVFRTAGRTIGPVVITVGVALAEGLLKSVKAAAEHQQVTAQTAAAIKSPGGAANVTAAHAGQYAKFLQRRIAVSRDTIQASENALLAFTNIRNQVGDGNQIFDRATVVVQDFSARTGRDAASAAVLFGKALEDPANKVAGLARAGVVFSQKLRDQIKTMAGSGDILGAQKLILQELERRYAGAGKAAGKTFGGKLKILRLEIRNIEILIGNALLPMLTEWSASLDRWAANSKNQRKAFHDMTVAVRVLTKLENSPIGSVFWAKILTRQARGWITLWNAAKKHTMKFFNWAKKYGLELALSVIEPFSHLPGFLGGKRFQKMKSALEAQLASGSVATAAAAATVGPHSSPDPKTHGGNVVPIHKKRKTGHLVTHLMVEGNEIGVVHTDYPLDRDSTHTVKAQMR